MNKKRTAAQIRAYCEAATKGPWRLHYGRKCPTVMAKRLVVIEVRPFTGQTEADSQFCANARVDLPRVLEVAVKAIELLKRCWTDAHCGRIPSGDTMTAMSELLDETMRLKTGEYETTWLEEEPDGST